MAFVEVQVRVELLPLVTVDGFAESATDGNGWTVTVRVATASVEGCVAVIVTGLVFSETRVRRPLDGSALAIVPSCEVQSSGAVQSPVFVPSNTFAFSCIAFPATTVAELGSIINCDTVKLTVLSILACWPVLSVTKNVIAVTTCGAVGVPLTSPVAGSKKIPGGSEAWQQYV